MMYPYITLADETEITHSHIMDSDGVQIVEVHFERPVEKGFCSARCSLPSYKWKFIVPSLFRIGGYLVFFWSNENGEPIHVHIAKGKPSPNATKIWLTCTGQCVVANNDSRIPQSDLKELLDVISAQFFMICRKWKEHFCVEEIQFFC